MGINENCNSSNSDNTKKAVLPAITKKPKHLGLNTISESETNLEDEEEVTNQEGGNKVGAASGEQEYMVLFKRVEHLVFAAFILNGTLSMRSVVVSILILKLFPYESPISEKILRLYQRVTDECLPSDHFNRKYSLFLWEL